MSPTTQSKGTGSTMAPNSGSTPWLVRTLSHQILGPFPKDQVIQWIQSGRISLQDEICSNSGYWFFIHEKDELKKNLGIELPRADVARVVKRDAFGEDEVTETDPGHGGSHSRPSAAVMGGSDFGGEGFESTRVLSAGGSAGASGSTGSTGSTMKGSPVKGAPVQVLGDVRLPRHGKNLGQNLGQPLVHSPDFEAGNDEPSESKAQFGWLLLAGIALVVVAVLRLARLQ